MKTHETLMKNSACENEQLAAPQFAKATMRLVRMDP